MLENGTLLLESSDPESARAFFLQLQSARPVTPEDLRRHDEKTARHLTRFGSRWSLLLAVGPVLLVVLLVLVGVGLLLGQFDGTETVGGWLFWLGIPIAVLVYLTMKVGVWRLEGGLRRIQQDAGLVPGMVDEIEHQRGSELIGAHRLVFRQERVTLES